MRLRFSSPVVQLGRLRIVRPVQKTGDSTVLVQLWGAVVFEAVDWGRGPLLSGWGYGAHHTGDEPM